MIPLWTIGIGKLILGKGIAWNVSQSPLNFKGALERLWLAHIYTHKHTHTYVHTHALKRLMSFTKSISTVWQCKRCQNAR